MTNQYEVLGKAPEADDLKKLSPENIHLTIGGLSSGNCNMEILHNFDLFVSKEQYLCFIGQAVLENLQFCILYMVLQIYFQVK